jgi:hypothetical protein
MAQRRTLARSVSNWSRRWSSLAAALQEEGGFEEKSFFSKAVTSSDQTG